MLLIDNSVNIILLVILVYIVYVWLESSLPSSSHVYAHSDCILYQTLTQTELSSYKTIQTRIIFSLRNKLFDVTKGYQFYGPG